MASPGAVWHPVDYASQCSSQTTNHSVTIVSHAIIRHSRDSEIVLLGVGSTNRTTEAFAAGSLSRQPLGGRAAGHGADPVQTWTLSRPMPRSSPPLRSPLAAFPRFDTLRTPRGMPSSAHASWGHLHLVQGLLGGSPSTTARSLRPCGCVPRCRVGRK